MPAPGRWREWMGRVEAELFAPPSRFCGKIWAGRGPGLEPRTDHRGYPRRIARPSVRNRFRRWRMKLSAQLGFGTRSGPDRGFGKADDEVERAGADLIGISADHPRGAVAVPGTGSFPETRSPRCGVKVMRRAAQPFARRALRRCHAAGIFSGICARERARSPISRSSKTRGCSAGPARRFSKASAPAAELRGVLGPEERRMKPEEDAA